MLICGTMSVEGSIEGEDESNGFEAGGAPGIQMWFGVAKRDLIVGSDGISLSGDTRVGDLMCTSNFAVLVGGSD